MLLKRITFAHGFLFLSVNFLRVLVGLLSEAATGGYEKLLLRISQYSQETLMLESLFNKVAGLIGPATLLKSDANTGGFL